VPVRDGNTIARTLVSERLAACVNITPVQSVYRWQGRVAEEEEVLLIMKTQASRIDALMARIPQIHPNTVPEVVVLSSEAVLPSYLAWAVAETAPG